MVNANQGAILLRLSVSALTRLELSSEVSVRRKQLSFLVDAPAVARRAMLSFWQEVLLFRPPPTLVSTTPPVFSKELKIGAVAYYLPTSDPVKVLSLHSDDPSAVYVTISMPGGREKQTTAARLSTTFVPPGLSPQGIVRICGNAGNNTPRPPPSATVLAAWKVAILKVVRTELLPKDSVVLPHVLIGVCDTHREVKDIAQEYLKRMGSVGRHDLEEKAVVQALLSLFVGGHRGSLPCAWALRAKILAQLLHSQLVCTMAPWCVKLTFESLFGPGTTRKVQCAGCEFAKRFVESATDLVLAPVKALLLQALTKMFHQSIGGGSSSGGGGGAAGRGAMSASDAGVQGLPRLYVVNGEKEIVRSEGDLFVDRARRLGVDATHAVVEGKGHCPGFPEGVLEALLKEAIRSA